MSIFKRHLLLSLAFVTPLFLHASGFGLSVPINLTETESSSHDSSLAESVDEYKPSSGLGFVYDTNIGQNRQFSYRLNLEYSLADIDTTNRLSNPDFSKHKYSVINTFGFSIYDSPKLRFWAGPRILVQYEHISSHLLTTNNYGAGLGAVIGINVHVTKKISLGADLDYHGVFMFGGESSKQSPTDSTDYAFNVVTNKGATARLFLLLRVGETYEQKKPALTDTSAIDNSL